MYIRISGPLPTTTTTTTTTTNKIQKFPTFYSLRFRKKKNKFSRSLKITEDLIHAQLRCSQVPGGSREFGTNDERPHQELVIRMKS